MKYRVMSVVALTVVVSACASQKPSISDSYKNQLMAMAPKVENCEAIDQVYSDLSTAPPEVVANLSSQVVEVWTLKGCPDGKRKRAELRIMNNNNGTLSFSEY
ncbi:hypothetical protein [Microbulbifer aestuariivivens]|uniref:hypothetical protein n=1 Tax=Microbulbifer aestuariivivens TaxID=1908308 RepID=UPI0031E6F8DE